MAEDYDTRRRPKGTVEMEVDSLEGLKIQRTDHQTAVIDVDYSEGFELPDTDDGITFSEDELTAPVIPLQRAVEFVCSSCFMARKIIHRAYDRNGKPVCNDCA